MACTFLTFFFPFCSLKFLLVLLNFPMEAPHQKSLHLPLLPPLHLPLLPRPPEHFQFPLLPLECLQFALYLLQVDLLPSPLLELLHSHSLCLLLLLSLSQLLLLPSFFLLTGLLLWPQAHFFLLLLLEVLLLLWELEFQLVYFPLLLLTLLKTQIKIK